MKREILLVPVTFTVSGMAAGLCWAMLYRHTEERAQVHLWDSMPAVILGCLLGRVIGEIVLLLGRKKPQLSFGLTVLSGALLAGSVAAVFGWIIGDNMRGRPGTAGMAWGAATGCVIGALLGLVQAIADRRGKKKSEILDTPE